MAYTTIDKPSDYFNTILWTGNDTDNRIISGVGFAPNWSWIKARNNADQHYLVDTVRGSTKVIFSDSTSSEQTRVSAVKAFYQEGYILGQEAQVNRNGGTFVSWNWKAGTAVSGNSTGSGTAKAYSGSVNTDVGFSIIKYIGNGTSAHTIPHHLGAVPQWVLIKETSNGSDWMGYHIGIGNTKTIKLNEPEAPVTRTDWWNDTTPTSSVVTLGDNGEINQNDTNYIMYSFSQKQGYSKFSSYIGNGNANGTFVYTGFKPAFIIQKEAGNTRDWTMIDNTRSPFNAADDRLVPNTSNAEVTNNITDLLSNGFKMRNTQSNTNGNGSSYIYMAFAENPFVTSTGVPATAR